MTVRDPLEYLAAEGIRVKWVHDYDRRMHLVRGARMIIADADLNRTYVAAAGIVMWREGQPSPRSAVA